MDVVYVFSKGEEIKIIYGVLVLSTGIKPQKKIDYRSNEKN